MTDDKNFEINDSMNNLEYDLERALNIINNSQKVIITTHMNPDGDAIGSTLGLYHYLEEISKDPLVISIDPPPPNIAFLEGTEKIQIYKPELHDNLIRQADTIIIVDLNDASRLRDMDKPILESNATKIIIDHHIDPKDFGDLYIIDTNASSVGEILWRLFGQDENYIISKKAADALYVAILTDSGSFRFPRTDAELHYIIADLINSGADPVALYDEVYNQMPFRSFKLKSEGYSKMKLYFDGILCLMPLPWETFEKHNAIEDDIEGFVEELLSIKGVRIGILITEVPQRNEHRVSFRSKANYSVREIASHFGGGGHEYAAGARIQNHTMEEVINLILAQVENLVNTQK